jgi:radical SAM superfamily enzyme YgiQ (UPF0313 family)
MAYQSSNSAGYRVDLSKLKNYSFEMGAIRPPSEGGYFSLLLRVTRNCPWNRCGFCYGSPYNHEKFQLRSVEEVKADIDAVKAISDEVKALSWKLGFGGRVPPLGSIMKTSLETLADSGLKTFHSAVNVFNWLCFGGKTAFLQDADTPILYTNQLVEIIKYLKETLPSLERITSYARSKTISKKKPEELKQLHEAGLARLHIGLETGDDELLNYVNKGVTAEEHILAGRKALEAGFELSEYIMPGLGGKARWADHARNTARVLSEINPHFIRSRPFVPQRNTPMFEAYEKGEYELTSPHERLQEIRLMVENLEVTSRVCFDHQMNPCYWSGRRLIPLLKQDYEGYRFPEEKELVLEIINEGLKIEESAFVDATELMRLPHL